MVFLTVVHTNAQVTSDSQTQKLAYSTREAAQAIGTSEVTILRLIKRGQLRCCSALRHKIIPAEELNRFLRDSLGEVQ